MGASVLFVLISGFAGLLMWDARIVQSPDLPALAATWAVASFVFWLAASELLGRQPQALAGDSDEGQPTTANHLEKPELTAILSSMTEGIILYDLDLNPVLTNPALDQLAQPGVHGTAFLDPDNLFRDRWANPQQIAEIERQLRVHPERPRMDRVELRNPRQYLKRYSSPLYNEVHEQTGHLVVFHDVTSEFEADQMRSEFVSNASHELRTPVTSMKVLVENVQEMLADLQRYAGQAKSSHSDTAFAQMERILEIVAGFVSDVSDEANRMHQLVDDLLDLARLNSHSADLRIGRLNAARVVAEAVATIAPQVRKKQIDLRLQLPDEVPLAADRVQLRQILVNLLGNAVKYTQDGGTVVLAVADQGDRWEFRVQDNGIGIPEADLPHIFDRFFRVGRDRARSAGLGGSGLGLSIAKSAVEAHGGQIFADSKVGLGTTFRFTIPTALEAMVPAPEAAGGPGDRPTTQST
ncbi:MAG: cell wall metabolism sensor histidine kinase WalK [Cyanobacteria bacterium REEB65]|nr:cell wall metabolism sensor histidine kinase WalK [Cyanobacteria bacterium REEB65]